MSNQTNSSLDLGLSDNRKKILEQYNSDQGIQFYQTVMGDFGFSIHYGIYENPDESVGKASENVIKFMANLIDQRLSLGIGKRIVDLGSGYGGAAHHLALNYGCRVTCVNICPDQNQVNLLQAKKLGIANLIDIVECSFEDLPQDWTNQFDAVWSEEAFCHAEDKHQVIKEVNRVLKPGGICVFSDIMRGENVDEADTNTFSDRNAVTGLGSVSDYIAWSSSEGLKNVTYHDFTSHLGINFQKMIDQIDQFWDQMVDGSVSEEYLKQFRTSLVDRLDAFENGSFSWGCFEITKALDISSISA
ncbi:methyltransferase domain-containing protein [Nodularia harveyana UHCC-0300]|uniref:Methyltransferase domain-containing protein n=1 Tax=Nodularia harveyana UHCC-0300 TaxID=2974287 RepID=A0ABU5U942_9CYAN|nr:methyltransferase domain-containing protein [Nodularia harveyana]MEA5580024.1 methyltransferase domain-containing protein [Nodularia harveyana UHCC-0300]